MNKPQDPRRALGKGLSSLLPSRPLSAPPAAAPAASEPDASPSNGLQEVNIDDVLPHTGQPRSVFQPERLQELAASIRTNGILQPLLVRRVGESFEIVAGERRWRAAKIAGLERVPVIIQDIADESLLTLALIENIQREDLNPIEVAIAFERLSRELNLTHEEIGHRTGKDRTTITNSMRLLRLPQDLQLLVGEQRLSMGQARAILGLPTDELMRTVAEKAIAQGLSVRAVERLVQEMTETREAKAPAETEARQDPNVAAAVEELQRALGTRVRIVPRTDQKGRIEIEYYSMDELHRLYQQIVGE
jgi:ParB family transcriptional regulator, chromosome partitioning protein